MPFPFELFRQDITLFKSASGSDNRQVTAAGTLDLYWKGATVSGPASGGAGTTIAVYDVGTLSVGDTVTKNGIGTSGTINSILSPVSIIVDWGATVGVQIGDRLVITSRQGGLNNRPIAYSDVAGSNSLGSQLSTDSTTGSVGFYTRARDVDIVATSGGGTRVFVDQSGQGFGASDAFDFGVWADGITSDSIALQRLIDYKIRKGGLSDVILPPGTILLTTGITVGGPLRVAGAGRGATVLTTASNSITLITLSGSDVALKDMTIDRSVTALAGSILVNVTGFRNTVKNLILTKGAIGILDSGHDTVIDDIVCADGNGWAHFYKANAAFRCHIRSLRGIDSTNTTNGMIYVTGGSANLRFIACDCSVSVSTLGHIGLVIDATGGAPFDIEFVGCRWFCGNGAAQFKDGVSLAGGFGLRFIGCTMDSCGNGYTINGATDVQILGGAVYSSRFNSVNIDAGNQILIMGLASADPNQGGVADNRADHVNIAAGIQNVSVIGLSYFRLNFGTLARHAVSVEAGVGAFILVLGSRGTIADLTSSALNNVSSSPLVDWGHNVGNASGQSHFPGPMATGETIDGFWGRKVVTSGTTVDVSNVSTIEFNHGGATNFNSFTGGQPGQVLTLIFRNANTTIVATGNIDLSVAGGNFAGTSGDTMQLIYDPTSTTWLEISRSVN